MPSPASDEPTSDLSNKQSIYSYNDDNKEDSESGPASASDEYVEIPRKPASEYVAVSIFCVMIAIGGFIFGWDTGTISGFVKQTDWIDRFGIRRPDGTKYLSKIRTGLMVAIFNVGCGCGGLLFSRLGDKFGRRPALAMVTTVYVCGIVIQIASINKWYQYMIGRIVSGFGVGGIAVYAPMLISEVAPKHIRGALVSCHQLLVTMGIFLGNCTNYGTRKYHNSRQWRVPLGLCFAWAIIMIIAVGLVPESPRYLLQMGRQEDARRSLAKSNKVSPEDPAITQEVKNLQRALDAEHAGGPSRWMDLFRVKDKSLKRTLMGIFLQAFQQLSGINYFFYYGTSIFKSVGLEDPFETAIVFGVVNFFSTFFGLYFVEHFGRRRCLLWGSAGMTSCMVVFASVGVKRLKPHGENGPSSKGAGNCMIVFSCFFIFCFATTWAPIAHVVVAESFPLRVRAKGIALCNSANWTVNFLIGLFTPFIAGSIGFNYGYVFMGCLCASYFFVFFFVPETKGLTLEEIDALWDEGVLPWKSAKWIPPTKRGANYKEEEMVATDEEMHAEKKKKFSFKF